MLDIIVQNPCSSFRSGAPGLSSAPESWTDDFALPVRASVRGSDLFRHTARHCRLLDPAEPIEY
jgi:hypothetical protein